MLKEHIEDEPHTLLECSSSPYYQNTALYPITEFFQRALQWQPDDTPEERLRQLERFLRPLLSPLEELVPLVAPLLSLSLPEARYPSLHLSAQQQRHKTLEAIVSVALQ